MRNKIIGFLKRNGVVLRLCWKLAKLMLNFWGLFVKIQPCTIVFASFGGRKFDDSPKALYDEICSRREFDDYRLVWAFINPKQFSITRGEKVQIDTLKFFAILLQAKVWISNSGMDRGVNLKRKGLIKVETWHGTPLKKIGGEENQNSLGGRRKPAKSIDNTTIRCAQSEYDQDIFARIFDADKACILLSDLPRNDKLLNYSTDELRNIRRGLSIPDNKKVILYTPTYREYLLNDENNTYIAPPINLNKWKEKIGDQYVLLVRTHYAVSASLGLQKTSFVKDVSDYLYLNDLFAISDMMISDYSSTFFDYSILDRPMFCFAYDLEEYEEKRGLYLKLEQTLPCPIDKTEDELLEHILNCDRNEYTKKTTMFHKRFAPHAGKASEVIVDKIKKQLEM